MNDNRAEALDEEFGLHLTGDSVGFLAEMQERLSAEIPRRELSDRDVYALMAAWREGTQNGRNLRELGALHVYLGWTEHELTEWRVAHSVPEQARGRRVG